MTNGWLENKSLEKTFVGGLVSCQVSNYITLYYPIIKVLLADSSFSSNLSKSLALPTSLQPKKTSGDHGSVLYASNWMTSVNHAPLSWVIAKQIKEKNVEMWSWLQRKKWCLTKNPKSNLASWQKSKDLYLERFVKSHALTNFLRYIFHTSKSRWSLKNLETPKISQLFLGQLPRISPRFGVRG